MEQASSPNPGRPGDSRRSFIKKAAAGTGAAWIAPTILSQTASAQGTGGLPPLLNANSNQIAAAGVGSVGSVSSVLTVNAQVLWIAIPLGPTPGNPGAPNLTVVPTVAGGPAWTQLIGPYDSTTVVPGIASPLGLGTRLRVFVFYRIGAINVANQLVTLNDPDGGLTGFWKIVIAEFNGVTAISNDPGEAGAQGSGGAALPVTAPAITNNSANAHAMWFGSGEAAAPAFITLPAGYTSLDLSIFQATHHLASLGFPGGVGPGPIAAATGAIGFAEQNVGVHLVVEG